MAEAAAVSQHRFFCHSCKGQVSPKLPEYTCPRCESGFIEEVTDDASFLEGGADDSASTQFAELWDHLDHTMFFPDFRPFLSGGALDPEREPERVPPAQPELWGPGRPPRLPVTRRYRPRGSSRPDRSPAIEGIIQQIFAGFFANSAVPGSQHPFSCSWASWRTRGRPRPTRRRSRPCPRCRSLRSKSRRVWSARCARRITRRPSRCGSCPATTSSTAAASCPGWSWKSLKGEDSTRQTPGGAGSGSDSRAQEPWTF
ncbi:E3 ubiquitin-protein ligase RNF115 isoform X5 [Patagioenas fasciata]|uniref:E3 ubiquitin-protein ligase RNF115 isoform X5 n=1 Tax=Patagioenas fasciata TaxID=372321 RepID=UPI003A98D856